LAPRSRGRETIAHNVMRKEPNVYRRTLARAIEIAGGQEPLARFLACTPGEIAKWATGESNPPMPIFLAMVDIAAANALTPAALENLPAARARRSTWIPAANS
jgi:DNA-binding transcriptional regulator YdaS (Cro superfamily)